MHPDVMYQAYKALLGPAAALIDKPPARELGPTLQELGALLAAWPRDVPLPASVLADLEPLLDGRERLAAAVRALQEVKAKK